MLRGRQKPRRVVLYRRQEIQNPYWDRPKLGPGRRRKDHQSLFFATVFSQPRACGRQLDPRPFFVSGWKFEVQGIRTTLSFRHSGLGLTNESVVAERELKSRTTSDKEKLKTAWKGLALAGAFFPQLRDALADWTGVLPPLTNHKKKQRPQFRRTERTAQTKLVARVIKIEFQVCALKIQLSAAVAHWSVLKFVQQRNRRADKQEKQ